MRQLGCSLARARCVLSARRPRGRPPQPPAAAVVLAGRPVAGRSQVAVVDGEPTDSSRVARSICVETRAGGPVDGRGARVDRPPLQPGPLPGRAGRRRQRRRPARSSLRYNLIPVRAADRRRVPRQRSACRRACCATPSTERYGRTPPPGRAGSGARAREALRRSRLFPRVDPRRFRRAARSRAHHPDLRHRRRAAGRVGAIEVDRRAPRHARGAAVASRRRARRSRTSASG